LSQSLRQAAAAHLERRTINDMHVHCLSLAAYPQQNMFRFCSVKYKQVELRETPA
jgi:hypothetical protein